MKGIQYLAQIVGFHESYFRTAEVEMKLFVFSLAKKSAFNKTRCTQDETKMSYKSLLHSVS